MKSDVATKNTLSGFTLIEVIAALTIISVLALIAVSRITDTKSFDTLATADTIINHIRYVQSMAMKKCSFENSKKRGIKCLGIKCTGNDYWYFKGTSPDDATMQEPFPGEKDAKINISKSNLSVDAFTIFFDVYGIPYIAYTDTTTNTKLPSDLKIKVGAQTITITPETGFIQ